MKQQNAGMTVTKTALALAALLLTGEGILIAALALLIDCLLKDRGRLKQALCRWPSAAKQRLA